MHGLVTLANSDTNEGKSTTKRSMSVNLNSLCDFSLQVPKSPRYKEKEKFITIAPARKF